MDELVSKKKNVSIFISSTESEKSAVGWKLSEKIYHRNFIFQHTSIVVDYT